MPVWTKFRTFDTSVLKNDLDYNSFNHKSDFIAHSISYSDLSQTFIMLSEAIIWLNKILSQNK